MMFTRQHYHPNFKFSDINFMKSRKLDEIYEACAEIVCINKAVLTISRLKNDLSFDIELKYNSYSATKTNIYYHDLLKIIALLNEQDEIEFQTHDNCPNLPDEVESVYIDVSFEGSRVIDMRHEHVFKYLETDRENSERYYQIRLNTEAANRYKLSKLDDDGFHIAVLVYNNHITVASRKLGENGLTQIDYRREDVGDEVFNLSSKLTYENVGEFALTFLDS